MAELPLGSEARPLWVAVIGSGPSGFYAVDALFKANGLHVRADVFDRLPTPFGLVRGGVAPDHEKIKAVVSTYERTAAHPHFRFFGNVMLGRDVQVGELRAIYDCIIYAVGNETERRMDVPGEDLAGVHSATAFVGWYNGHPDFQSETFDLAGAKRVAVVGNGNVAMDVTRVLARDPDELAPTDIADAALAALRTSGVEEVLLLGRRGPAQAAFSPKEIQEVADLPHADLVVTADDVALDPVSRAWLESGAPTTAARNLRILEEQVKHGEGTHRRKIRCRFLVAPVEFVGESGRVTAVRLEHSELYADEKGTPRPRGTGRVTVEPVDLVFKAIGYLGVEIPGVPFHRRWGIIPNVNGRVTASADSDVPLPRQYVVGWAKRGPTGLIGTNNADSKATVAALLEDLSGQTAAALPPSHGDAIVQRLRTKGVEFVTYEDWLRLDAYEVAEGKKVGKVRRKLTTIPAMLDVVRRLRVQERATESGA